MNQLYHFFILFFAFTIASSAQIKITERKQILPTLDSLRSEVKQTYDDGSSKKRVYYYDNNNNFVKVINFTEDGKVSSVYNLDKGVKQEALKFDKFSGTKISHSYFHKNKKNAVDIFYDAFGNVESVYFYTPEGKDRFEVICDRVNGGFVKSIFNTNGSLVKKITQDQDGIFNVYFYNNRPHGVPISIDKEGNKKEERFMHKGVPEDFYEGWEDIIKDFDKIPEFEQQLDTELKKYGIVLDDTLGKGIKVKIKE